MEIRVDDLDGALAAERGGADRIGLSAGLVEGGPTPSHGLIETVLASVSSAGVQVMVRSRGGDLATGPAERRVMRADLRAIAHLAARAPVRAGVVLGVLRRDGRIDESALDELVGAADGLPATFHRAFDETPDPVEAHASCRRTPSSGC